MSCISMLYIAMFMYMKKYAREPRRTGEPKTTQDNPREPKRTQDVSDDRCRVLTQERPRESALIQRDPERDPARPARSERHREKPREKPRDTQKDRPTISQHGRGRCTWLQRWLFCQESVYRKNTVLLRLVKDLPTLDQEFIPMLLLGRSCLLPRDTF